MELIFEWDKNKAKTNLKDHKVSFEEAKTVFQDDFAVTFFDSFHSDEEDRFISIGMSQSNRTLLVVYTENFIVNDEEVIVRIISCRKAENSERKIYEEGKE